MLPGPDYEGPKSPAQPAAALAILVAVLVVFVVFALRLTQVDESNFEKDVRAVQDAAVQVATIPLSDVDHSKTAWKSIIQRIDQVENDSRRADPILDPSRAQAQTVLASYAKAT